MAINRPRSSAVFKTTSLEMKSGQKCLNPFGFRRRGVDRGLVQESPARRGSGKPGQIDFQRGAIGRLAPNMQARRLRYLQGSWGHKRSAGRTSVGSQVRQGDLTPL